MPFVDKLIDGLPFCVAFGRNYRKFAQNWPRVGRKMSAHAAPLPPQSVLKHTAAAAVAAAAAAALDLSERRISHRINGVFVVTSAPAASERFFFLLGSGGPTGEKRRENVGRLPAPTYSGRARWRTVIGWKEETFVRFFIVRLNRCGSRELKSLLRGKSGGIRVRPEILVKAVESSCRSEARLRDICVTPRGERFALITGLMTLCNGPGPF